jgi:hypothetical protein
MLNQGDDAVSLLEDPAHPLVEYWFIDNLGGKCELSYLKRVRLFEVGDMSQGCSQGYKPITGPKSDPNKIHFRTEEV